MTLIAVTAILEWTMPYSAKPSVMLGEFIGRHDAAHLDTARAAQVRMAREVAIAQAAPPAAYQQETIILQQQQQALAASLGTQGLAANLADAACIASMLWRDPGRDWREVRDNMRDLGCGLGDELRGNMVRQLSTSARENSAIVPRTAAPDPARMPVAIMPPSSRPSSVAPVYRGAAPPAL